jgi:hypothetical protein
MDRAAKHLRSAAGRGTQRSGIGRQKLPKWPVEVKRSDRVACAGTDQFAVAPGRDPRTTGS